ncbi:MAG TPA: crosslink repair DNA glycosylase YcaQ family protein [Gaiellaceae bacterium]|nr:crosslink repair DNA glycosylase YcaQ family protein [Gaiellaceae bacterium]
MARETLAGVAWDEVRAARCVRSHLGERAPAERLVDVVRDVCGIHAQVTAAAELSLCARVEGIRAGDVRSALWERRELAKAWTLRGTLHLHPADELGLWTAARRAVVGARDYEVDGLEGVEDVVAAIDVALRGRRLLREELADEVAARGLGAPREKLASGWGYYLGDAAMAGVLVFGPPQGQKVTFVHPRDWLGEVRAWEPRAALREIARRYAATYAPATPRAFAEWAGARSFRAREAEALWEEVELREPEPVSAAPTVRLLPEYDAYVMAFREREHLVPPEVRELVAVHGRGRYEGPAAVPFVLVDGLCVGIWSRRRRGRRIELEVRLALPLPRHRQEELEAERQRVAQFLGLELVR